MSLQDFRTEFLEDIRNEASRLGTDAEDVFIQKTFEIIEQAGDASNPKEHYFFKNFANNRAIQINGYSYDEADKTLILIISDFENKLDPENINRQRIEGYLFKRMNNFLKLSLSNKLSDYCDDSDEILKISKEINSKLNDPINGLLKIRYLIITNKKISDRVKKIKQDDMNGKPVEVSIWHIERFFEYLNSANNEPLYIDFKKDFKCATGITCLKADIGDSVDYDAYIAIISGDLLAQIYIEHGSKILEGNVRAFLGITTQSVNAGIKKTAINEPSNFFTYNNGVAITASKVETELINGVLTITAIEDMQIINGGQTTATIASIVLKKETNNNFDKVFIPAKITVIQERERTNEDGSNNYDSMVSNISKYANSQNKVTTADLFSNHPFHIELEKNSRRHFTPLIEGSTITTGWYYERSRKKYNQEQIKMSKTDKVKFSKKFPKDQVITKEKLSKYIYSVEQKPHIVSKGNDFIMKTLGEDLEKASKLRNISKDVNEYYFKKCICYSIIFNTVDKIVVSASWYKQGGYKLNIVPYTISYIFSLMPPNYSIDWDKIWQKQDLYNELYNELGKVAKYINDFIYSNNNGMIITEYCKKEATWELIKTTLEYTPSIEFIESLTLNENLKIKADLLFI